MDAESVCIPRNREVTTENGTPCSNVPFRCAPEPIAVELLEQPTRVGVGGVLRST